VSPVRVTCSRTLGRLHGLFSTSFAIGGFLAASAFLFVTALESAEGGRLAVACIWASAVSPFLPALASFLAMDSWSDERRSGRIETLLSSPVRERELVFGKYFGVLTLLAASTLGSMLLTVLVLAALAPSALSGAGFASFLMAFVALMLQGALWCAVSVAMSALFRHAATAACASLMLLVALPRGGWEALLALAPQGRTAFGAMPLDDHAVDMASGLFSSGTVLSYLILTGLFLFVCTKAVAYCRFDGRGGRGLRVSTWFAVVLSFVFSALAIMLVDRFDAKIDLPDGNAKPFLSDRTRGILAEARGETMTVTCFLSRRDGRFRSVGRLLRAFQREAASTGSLRMDLRFVDPRWDVGAAERLVRLGAGEGSVVFEPGHGSGQRGVVVPLSDGFGEHVCASSVQRLIVRRHRRNVYWTVGHGEASIDDYGAWGMSDIARDLSRDGYRNLPIDLSGDTQIPAECALIVVAGAKEDFSRAEAGRIEAYLRSGGRLLVLVPSADSCGVTSLLPVWGVRPTAFSATGVKTLSGTDVVVDELSDHVITHPLVGSRIILERPVAFLPSAAAESGAAGADRIEFTSIARAGGATVAAAVERGVGAGADLSIRPTRIVVVGDASFVMNGQLSVRANANRDFLLNCAAYLSGSDSISASGAEAGTLVTGLDRAGRRRLAGVHVVAVPGVVFLVFAIVAAGRRRRRA